MAKISIAKKVKIWNRHTEDYSQVVKGEAVHIPAGKYIECSRRKGLDIRGHYPGKGIICKLEIEPIYEEVDEPEQYMDHRTGEIFGTREALLKHLGINPEDAKLKLKCGLCDAPFDDKAALAAHMTVCLSKFQKEKKPVAA
jgi:hypothetical protein